MSSPGKRKILRKTDPEKEIAKEIKQGLVAMYAYHLGELSEIYMPSNFPETSEEVVRTVSDHVENNSNNFDSGQQPTIIRSYYIEREGSRVKEIQDFQTDALKIEFNIIEKKFSDNHSFRYEEILSLPSGKMMNEYIPLAEVGDIQTQVLRIEEELADDMDNLREDDIEKVSKLDILDSNNEQLAPIAELDQKKNEEAQQYYNNLQVGIEEMKEQDKNDIDELVNIKGQLDQDLSSAQNDLEILKREKPEGILSPEDNNTEGKNQAVRQFLMHTINQRNEGFGPIIEENQLLREKAYDLRNRVKDKYLNNIGGNEEEVNQMLVEYEDLLNQHVSDFQQFDGEMDDQVQEFSKYADLWKQLFTEGMDLEKKCDDIDYELEALSDKERELTNLKNNLHNLTSNYQGKLADITDFQKDTIDNLREEISKLEEETNNLKAQINDREGEVSSESLAIMIKRSIKDEPDLEGVMGEFAAAHKSRKEVQDDAENVPEGWIDGHKTYAKNALSEAESQKDQSSANHRIKDILEQIHQSNEDIEKLLADLQRIGAEKGLNEHRNNLHKDMSEDLADVRSRLEYELSQKEKLLVELGEYATGDLREQVDLLLTQIQELRTYLREKWTEQTTQMEEIRVQIESYRENLKRIISESYNLKVLIIEEEHHNDIKRNLLRNRDEYIERLKIAIGDAETRPAVEKPAPETKYVARKGDEIDMLLAEALNSYGVDIPMTRLGGGFYLFGTRKIFAKIMNGRLVVRVGGGYMIIDEFLATNSEMELIKINKMMSNEGVEIYEELKVYRKYQSENPEAFKTKDPSRRTIVKPIKNKPKAHERGRF